MGPGLAPQKEIDGPAARDPPGRAQLGQKRGCLIDRDRLPVVDVFGHVCNLDEADYSSFPCSHRRGVAGDCDYTWARTRRTRYEQGLMSPRVTWSAATVGSSRGHAERNVSTWRSSNPTLHLPLPWISDTARCATRYLLAIETGAEANGLASDACGLSEVVET